MLRKALPILLVLLFLVSLAYATKVCPNCGREFTDDCDYCMYCLPTTKLVPLGGEEVTNEIKTVGPDIVLVKIPGGTFSMGSNEGDSNEKPVHTVTLDDFWMGESEVTIAQYAQFLNESNPSISDREKWIAIDGEVSWYWTGTGDEWKEGENDNCHIYYQDGQYKCGSYWEDHPVVNVSWYGAKAFCDYYGLRLPTEAEWEYAAGGPNHYKYPWGDNFDQKACCYTDNQGTELPPTMAVESFDANGYGIYDMAGNVWEWCSDWYGKSYYNDSPGRNPQGPSSGDYKILRGGSWLYGSNSVRCASRLYYDPSGLIHYFGFRCVGD